MKIPKLQFGLASIFVAFIGMAIVMSFYRHHAFVEERIHLHSQLRLDADRRLGSAAELINVLVESRGALLAGDEDHLESLASRYKIGQPLVIAYVPVQLAQLDKNVRDFQDESAQQEVVRNYHAELVVEYEKVRWQPWRRVTEPLPAPTSLTMARAAQGAPTPQPGQQPGAPVPQK